MIEKKKKHSEKIRLREERQKHVNRREWEGECKGSREVDRDTRKVESSH